MDLGNGLIIQLAVYLVVEACSLEKEIVTPLPLNMVVTTVMANHEKIVPAGKQNVQVVWDSLVFIGIHMSCFVVPLRDVKIIETLIKPKCKRKQHQIWSIFYAYIIVLLTYFILIPQLNIAKYKKRYPFVFINVFLHYF